MRPPATTIVQQPPRALSLGEWCIQRGLTTRDHVDQCLRLQKDLAEQGRKAPRLGELLLERGYLSLDSLLKALAGQRREVRHCPRCRFQTTVPIGAAHTCGACLGPLLPSPDLAVDVREEFVAVPDRDALPEDVRLSARNPGSRFGKYILVRELGCGGVGRVFLAWDPFLSQFVAVKRLRTDFDGKSQQLLDERRRMLLQEARTAIRLRHPGVVSVYDVGRIDDDPYISMEYVDGVTLHDRLQAGVRSGALSAYFADPKTTLAILVEVARALDYAHTMAVPIIHCDLKPSNVMIGRDGHARLLDFGLARAVKTDAAGEAEYISGTPAYMAPEQARGDLSQMDARTDVYAFGAILYECLTGRTPFVGAPFEILHLTLSASPEPPSKALAARRGADASAPLRIPEALESLCLACLERDPGRRPFSLEDVARTLEALMSAPPTPATPSPAPQSARKATTVLAKPSLSPRPSRRRQLLLTGALVLALLGLGLLPMASRRDLRDLAAFRPESARSLLPGRREEIDRVRGLKLNLIDALARRPVALSELRLRGGLPVAVQELAGCDWDGIVLSTGRGIARVEWSSLEPAQIVALARLALPAPSPSDRLGLAIFCLETGQSDEARRLLLSLRDTACAPQAERYLDEVNQ